MLHHQPLITFDVIGLRPIELIVQSIIHAKTILDLRIIAKTETYARNDPMTFPKTKFGTLAISMLLPLLLNVTHYEATKRLRFCCIKL